MIDAVIVNDVHAGVVRTAGTTQNSRRALKEYIRDSLRELMFANLHRDFIFNGDLFDGFQVETHEIFEMFIMITEWMSASKRAGHKSAVKVGMGNHDISKDSEKLSAFHFLCKLLMSTNPDRVQVIDSGLTKLYPHVWMIPHMVNQEAFDAELDCALEIEPCHLLLHANVDNDFAKESDHSLNVSDERINALIGKGHTLIFGHEHHRKVLYKGNVIVTGNQWPSSIYDCLSSGTSQEDGFKYAHILHDEEHADRYDLILDKLVTWDSVGSYQEMDWRDPVPTTAQFIRFVGNATVDEAADVVSKLAEYRMNSEAFVVGNAVHIEGVKGMEDMHRVTQEQLSSINVMEILKENLEPEEAAMVDQLWNNRKQK